MARCIFFREFAISFITVSKKIYLVCMVEKLKIVTKYHVVDGFPEKNVKS
jgi:hypothetical protein